MKIETSRDKTTIELGKAYCFNFDKMIEACVYLSAKEYWENGGGKGQAEVYKSAKDKYSVREYKRLEFALKRFEGMTEDDIFDGIAYGYEKPNWKFGMSRNQHRYDKTIETLFELRGMMWT